MQVEHVLGVIKSPFCPFEPLNEYCAVFRFAISIVGIVGSKRSHSPIVKTCSPDSQSDTSSTVLIAVSKLREFSNLATLDLFGIATHTKFY